MPLVSRASITGMSSSPASWVRVSEGAPVSTPLSVGRPRGEPELVVRDRADRNGFLGHRLDDLLLRLALLTRAHDPEAPGAQLGVGPDRQAADHIPAEPLDLERV